jgi:hypothetical protein
MSTSNSNVGTETQPLLSSNDDTTGGSTATSTSNNNTSTGSGTIVHDVYDTIKLGIPIFFSMLSWVGMKTTDSALLGHVSSQALSAAALSDLVRVFKINLLVVLVCFFVCYPLYFLWVY